MELLITPQVAGFSNKRLLLTGVFTAAAITAVGVMGHFLWPAVFVDPPLDTLGIAVVIGFLTVVHDKLCCDYKVFVSDDSITAVYDLYKHSIRKNEVKTVSESDGNFFLPPSLRISKYGSLGTRLRGDIRIPKALPEYAAIRELALRWKNSNA